MAGERILVLDDEFAVRSLCSYVLEMQGFDVFAVEDGEEGVIAVRQAYEEGNPFFAYLCDVIMSGNQDDVRSPKNGTEFYELIKREEIDNAPMIFMSGGMNEYQRDKIIELEAFAVLAKPFESARLISDTIENAINNPFHQTLIIPIEIPIAKNPEGLYLA